jgi:hypothetical protein
MTDPNPSRHLRLSHWRLVLDRAGITPEVKTFRWPGAGTQDDPFVVEWLIDDPRNPLMFSRSRKWGITSINSLETLSVAFASSAISGGSKQVEVQFSIGSELMALSVSVFVLGKPYNRVSPVTH